MKRLPRAAEMSHFMGTHRRLSTDSEAQREPARQGRAGRLGRAGEERPLGRDECPRRLRECRQESQPSGPTEGTGRSGCRRAVALGLQVRLMDVHGT